MGDATRDRFARQVAIALRIAGGTDIEYDADEFCLRYTKHDRPGWVANLSNLFHECGSAPPDVMTVQIKRFAGFLAAESEPATGWEQVAGLLRPVLNPAQMAEYRGTRMLAREFLPFVNEMVVIDGPDTMSYVSVGQPADWGRTDAQVFDRARENLAARAHWPPDEPETHDRDVILRMPETGSEYWVSHLLLDGWLAAWTGHVGGRPVAFAADRTGLTIVADKPDIVEALLDQTEKEYLESTRYLSPLAYTVDDANRVAPYSVPRGDPMWNAVHRSETLLASKEYDAYKEEHEDDLDPDTYAGYLGGYQVGTRPDGSVYSVAVWGQGVATLLPKTDFVAVIDEAHEHFVVPFDTLVRTFGLATHPGLYPPRYRTPEWMSERQWGSLRAQAVEP